MYDERIENLLNLALVDGVLTEKEREILIRKAVEQGVDRDEFEMVLDARLYEKQSEMKLSEPTVQSNPTISASPPPPPPPVMTSPSESSKSEKVNSKCPACGGLLATYSTKCSDCGHEVAHRDNNATIQKLFEMLNEVEGKREDKTDTSNPFKAFGAIYAEAFSSMSGPGAIERKKMEIISSFPIPTTKGDMLEFLALAVPKAKQKGNFFTKANPENKVHNEMVPVWKTKCEQIIIKAKFALKDDPKTMEEINYYAKELEI